MTTTTISTTSTATATANKKRPGCHRSQPGVQNRRTARRAVLGFGLLSLWFHVANRCVVALGKRVPLRPTPVTWYVSGPSLAPVFSQPERPTLKRQPALFRVLPLLVVSICPKRFSRRYSWQPALLYLQYRALLCTDVTHLHTYGISVRWNFCCHAVMCHASSRALLYIHVLRIYRLHNSMHAH